MKSPKGEAKKNQNIERPIWFVEMMNLHFIFSYASVFLLNFPLIWPRISTWTISKWNKSDLHILVCRSCLGFLLFHSTFSCHSWGLDNWIMVMEINTIVIGFVWAMLPPDLSFQGSVVALFLSRVIEAILQSDTKQSDHDKM